MYILKSGAITRNNFLREDSMEYISNVASDYQSYNYLINFYSKYKDIAFEHLVVDFSSCSWFGANNCSIMGALLHKLMSNGNAVSLINFNNDVEKILIKNNFLSFFGYNKIFYDSNDTTIQYLKLDLKDIRYFTNYIQNELISKKEFPSVSDILKKKIVEGIYEIFINAVTHSETKEGIFTCGQFFPKKDRIEFMLTDLGVGIRERVNKERGYNFNAIEAIDWALVGRNTTKKETGGLGLKIIKEFIKINKGKLQVISNNGFWEMNEHGIAKKYFSSEFPGTAVNLCINTSNKDWLGMIVDFNNDDLF